jgi:hypothetical protein
MIRLDFEDYSGQESLEHISWDEWFRTFEASHLALIVDDKGTAPNFNKLITRDEGSEGRSGRAGASNADRAGMAGAAADDEVPDADDEAAEDEEEEDDEDDDEFDDDEEEEEDDEEEDTDKSDA